MKTSVVITTYNRPLILECCLAALAVQRDLIHEVIVSDDGSAPPAFMEMERITAGFPGAIRMVGCEDRGYRLAAARNNGVRCSTGDYIISIDCDILLLKGSIEAHLRNAARGGFLAGNRALAGSEDTRRVCEGNMNDAELERLWERADKSHLHKAHRRFVGHALFRKIKMAKRHKPKILGCHFSLFREDFEKVNGFDERYEGWGLEDDDFAMRLHMAGIRGRSVILEARAVHLWHESVESRPLRISESPNYYYFKRRDVSAKCAKGLY